MATSLPNPTGQNAPEPPSLEQIYRDNITGGWGVVLQEYDRQFAEWNKQKEYVQTQAQPVSGGGGSQALLTPTERASRPTVSGSPETRLGWARMVRDDTLATSTLDGQGWPMDIRYTPSQAAGWRVEVFYSVPPVACAVDSIGRIDVSAWPIPQAAKARVGLLADPSNIAMLGLLNPVLRATLVPYSGTKFLYQTLYPNATTSILTIPSGPARTIAAGSLGVFRSTFSLNDRSNGEPVPVTRAYAELV